MSKALKIVLISIFVVLVLSFCGLVTYHHYEMKAKSPVRTILSGLEDSYTKMELSDDITANLSVSPAYKRTVKVFVKDGSDWSEIDEIQLKNKEKDAVELKIPSIWKSRKKTEFKVEVSKLQGKFDLFHAPHVIHSSKGKAVTFSVTTKKQIESQACAIVDAETGNVVYQWNGYKKLRPASLTKMMTAVLLCESTESDETIVVSSRAAQTLWSGLLSTGDELTRDDLLYCMMLPSANDAAEAAGDYVEEKLSRNFVEMMNEKANQLGMTRTVYESCCGLDTDGNVSCAVDQALLGRYLMTETADADLDTLRDVVRTPEKEVSIIRDKKAPVGEGVDEEALGGENKGKKKLTFRVGNTNHLLGADFDGIKTGYTDIAGPCFCGTFVSDGRRYVTVVLGGKLMDDRFNDTKKLKSLVDKGYFNSEE